MSCIFCQILAGKSPATIYLQGQDGIVIRPLVQLAPHHALVIPRRHVASLDDLSGSLGMDEQAALLGSLFRLADMYVTKHGLGETGYRAVFNTGADAHQTVPHLHLHIVGGAPLKEEFA